MSFKMSVVLLQVLFVCILASSAFTYEVEPLAYIELSLPDDAAEVGNVFLFDYIARLYPGEVISIGEPIELLSEDLAPIALSYPLAIDRENPITYEGEKNIYDSWWKAWNDCHDYYNSLDLTAGSLDLQKMKNGTEESYNHLTDISRAFMKQRVSIVHIVLGFDSLEPVILGMHRLVDVFSIDDSLLSEEVEYKLIGYGINSDPFGTLHPVGIYEDTNNCVLWGDELNWECVDGTHLFPLGHFDSETSGLFSEYHRRQAKEE